MQRAKGRFPHEKRNLTKLLPLKGRQRHRVKRQYHKRLAPTVVFSVGMTKARLKKLYYQKPVFQSKYSEIPQSFEAY